MIKWMAYVSYHLSSCIKELTKVDKVKNQLDFSNLGLSYVSQVW